MNNESYEMNDDLLVKCLLGEASREEQEAVAQWRNAAAANDRRYEQFRLIWEESRKAAAMSRMDTDAAWQRFQQRAAREPGTAKPPARAKSIAFAPRQWMRLAAMLVVMAGAGLTFYYFNQSSSMVARHSGGAVLVDTLPDGSVITLNKHSTLTYPRHFAGNTRAVVLDGEAFFDITPDKRKPFIINANGVGVKVVGTSFNVKSSAEQTVVVVETGIVEVRKQANAVKLEPHEQAVVSKDAAAPVKTAAPDMLYNYYRTREFVCDNTPLPRLIAVLNEAYHTEIVIADARLQTELITTTFREDSLQEVLDVLASQYNIAVQQEGSRYVLKSRNQ